MTRPDTREDILTLAACPFCGGDDLHVGGWVRCRDCNGEGPYTGGAGEDGEAVNAWNRRATPTPPAAEAPGQEQPCEYCNGDGDVHTIDGEWRGVCTCPAGDRYRATPPEPGQEPVAVKARLGWTDMPSYGEVSFSELVEAVAEATYADRHFTKGAMAEIDRTRFIGHQIVPTINFNSLNRIVSAFVRSALISAPPKQEPVAWRDPSTALKDGTMVRLLVRPGAEENDGWTPFEDSFEPYQTIGFNSLSDTDVDEWQFAGWDWSHDCFTSGAGEVIGWLPFDLTPAPPTYADAEAKALAADILAELVRARTKYPGRNVTFAALVEEVGELATATFEEGSDRVRKEAVQVAVMAMRMVLDGDHTFDTWRAAKGLDPLVDPTAIRSLASPAPKDQPK